MVDYTAGPILRQEDVEHHFARRGILQKTDEHGHQFLSARLMPELNECNEDGPQKLLTKKSKPEGFFERQDDAGNVAVAYIQFDFAAAGGAQENAMIQTSSDGGRIFTAPANVTNYTTTVRAFGEVGLAVDSPGMAIDGAGRVVLFWKDDVAGVNQILGAVLR